MEREDSRRSRQLAEDFTVTSQFWDALQPSDCARPEKDLMLAVLTDAIWDYKKNLAARNARFREARAWLFDGNSEFLFSFESICAMLNLNPSLIRGALLHWESPKTDSLRWIVSASYVAVKIKAEK